MVAFYLDEDMPEGLAPWLADRGHFATTTRTEGRKSAPDYRQLWFAADRNWIVLTVNRKDFIALHGAWLLWSHEWGVQPEHPGILVLPAVLRREYERTADTIDAHVRDPGTRLVNNIYAWQRAAGWVRSPRS